MGRLKRADRHSACALERNETVLGTKLTCDDSALAIESMILRLNFA